MNLRLKLFLPFVSMFAVIYFVSTFYLLPAYVYFLDRQQIDNEKAQIELLSTAIAPNLIEKIWGKFLSHWME